MPNATYTPAEMADNIHDWMRDVQFRSEHEFASDELDITASNFVRSLNRADSYEVGLQEKVNHYRSARQGLLKLLEKQKYAEYVHLWMRDAPLYRPASQFAREVLGIPESTFREKLNEADTLEDDLQKKVGEYKKMRPVLQKQAREAGMLTAPSAAFQYQPQALPVNPIASYDQVGQGAPGEPRGHYPPSFQAGQGPSGQPQDYYSLAFQAGQGYYASPPQAGQGPSGQAQDYYSLPIQAGQGYYAPPPQAGQGPSGQPQDYYSLSFHLGQGDNQRMVAAYAQAPPHVSAGLQRYGAQEQSGLSDPYQRPAQPYGQPYGPGRPSSQSGGSRR
ncbi:hypothetical protein ACQKH1_07120 [Staphylococcus capitis]|uniref:hypothetical protein n=1 Tax=Staphylococcus capitis TaxID=29388 RepID=UPI003D029BA7